MYCLKQLYDGRDMCRTYYIKNNYMFRHFTLAIFRFRNEKLSKQLQLHVSPLYIGYLQVEKLKKNLVSRFLNLKMVNVKCRNM